MKDANSWGEPDLPMALNLARPAFISSDWSPALMARLSVSTTAAGVPAGTPPEIVDKLAGAMANILAQPDMPEKLAVFGMFPFPLIKDKFAERIRADHAYYGKLIAQTGIRLD